MKRTLLIILNTFLALLIAAIILATWMPAIYTGPWFKQTFPRL